MERLINQNQLPFEQDPEGAISRLEALAGSASGARKGVLTEVLEIYKGAYRLKNDKER